MPLSDPPGSNTSAALTPMSDPLDRPLPAAGDDSASPEAGRAAREAASGAAPAPPARAVRAIPVSLPMLAGVLALALVAALAVWLDAGRTQQIFRMEVAQRLAGVESSTQAAGRAQTQLATDLRDAQAKITLLEARLAESQAEQAALEALYRDLAPSRDKARRSATNCGRSRRCNFASASCSAVSADVTLPASCSC